MILTIKVIMALLILYISVALGFSFLCSIAEAVLLSVTQAHIGLLEREGKTSTARRLQKLKDDINAPLAAILTLNTIAHTGGAAGAGAEATRIFGDEYLGLISGILTFMILVFSEIIPKTLGAQFWRQLAPLTAILLDYLILVLLPFVKLSDLMTKNLSQGPTLKGFSRQEFAAMAELSTKEGQLGDQESTIITNTLHLHQKSVTEILTPRTVVFSVRATLTVGEYFTEFPEEKFSRIPVFKDDVENIIGFVLRTDLLIAKAESKLDLCIDKFVRKISAVPETYTLSQILHRFLTRREQIIIVIDEHGGLEGIVTLEDVFEKMIGTDIVDESDKTENMRRMALSSKERTFEDKS